MGVWFFLTVVIAGNMLLKAYKWRILNKNTKLDDERITELELELRHMREKIQDLETAVFSSDFELKRQFKELEKEMYKSIA
jgi:predicted  nucleic acid-binding Zn-ribbon protein